MRTALGGMMQRESMLKELKATPLWDVIIIGGGATGLGILIDSAVRGYKTLLLEQSDFAAATSSRSTKLIHGGLRYLQQGNISLVIEALHERGNLLKNAPHLVHELPFLIPSYKWWEGTFYGIGVKIYDMLAGKLGFHPSKALDLDETLSLAPTLSAKGLRGSTIYYDGQFDDARLAITLGRTGYDHGGTLINYMRVTKLIKEHDCVTGVEAHDLESDETYSIHGKVVINATGPFSDSIRHMDQKKTKAIIAPSQGTHIVLPRRFHQSENAVLIPHTEDNRVIFIIPWLDHVLIGTTDTAISQVQIDPKPQEEEIEFLLSHAAHYLIIPPKKSDILSVFSGIRPLVKSGEGKSTSAISRDHLILVDPSGLLTIAGGKWTTYRKMAEDAVDTAIEIGALKEKKCRTRSLRLHGYKKADPKSPLNAYGTDAAKIRTLQKKQPSLKQKLHPDLPYTFAELHYAIHEEMARNVEDLLSRRTRALFLNAKACYEIAPAVAKLIRKELDYSQSWEKKQIAEFRKQCKRYIP